MVQRIGEPISGPKVGVRLLLFKAKWVSFCPDPWVVDVVSQGYRLEFTSPPPRGGGGRVTPVPSDPVKRQALEDELLALLRKGAATETTGQEGPLFLSSFFLATKKNGTWRPILNLKPLNAEYIG